MRRRAAPTPDRRPYEPPPERLPRRRFRRSKPAGRNGIEVHGSCRHLPYLLAIEKERYGANGNAPHANDVGDGVEGRDAVKRNEEQKESAERRPDDMGYRPPQSASDHAAVVPGAGQPGQAQVEADLEADRGDGILQDDVDRRQIRRNEEKPEPGDPDQEDRDVRRLPPGVEPGIPVVQRTVAPLGEERAGELEHLRLDGADRAEQ